MGEESFEIAMEELEPSTIKKEVKKKVKNTEEYIKPEITNMSESTPLVSCLRNEIITVRFIPRESGMITNPKHVFYGGMGEMAVRVFTVPILESSGQFVNVLTNEEKSFLEEYMGLEYNALSKYIKGEKNFWRNYRVRLTKGDNFLNLADPNYYIKYKVLLANKDFIAASLNDLQENPKLTYQFVMISHADEVDTANKELSSTMKAYLELGKIQDNFDILKMVVEMIDGRPISPNSKLEFVQSKVHKLIQADAKLFLKIVQDPYLETKVLISKAVEAGIITKRGDYYYYDNTPLCENNQDPILTVAAQYLNKPKHQQLKLSIEAKLT